MQCLVGLMSETQHPPNTNSPRSAASKASYVGSPYKNFTVSVYPQAGHFFLGIYVSPLNSL